MSEIRNIDWHEIVRRMSSFATSELGREQLSKTTNLKTSNDAFVQQKNIMELAQFVAKGTRPHMSSLDLFLPWMQRLSRSAVLKPLELRDVRHFCLEALALNEFLKSFNLDIHHFARSLQMRIMSAEEPLSAIDQLLTPGGDIRSDASEKLHNLNVEKANLAKQIQNTLDKAVKNYQIEHLLQDRYVTTREGRWVLPIKSGMQHGFQGIVHASSQTGQTVFMEPNEVIPINNRLREVENEIEAEIERLLMQLSLYLYGIRDEFESTKVVMIEADMRFAQAELAVHLDANVCQFGEARIFLKDIRHPLLSLAQKSVVTNTVELDSEKRILLLSGPNAGGKTVLLKSIGLAAQMARCGLPICVARDSEIPFFKNIVVSVGDAQSVDADLSTFAAHLKTLDFATTCLGLDSLLLIDEICGSTDPEEGAALARSFIDNYRENQVFGVITSHLGALKRAWSPETGIINGSLDFDAKDGPTYRFIMGIPGSSLAIQTAERAKVNPKIIQRALDN